MLRSGEHAISLVVLDMTMPIMSGEETLPKIDSRVPVVVSSGYSETEVLRRFAGLRFAAFLQKPFTANTLTQAVTTALARIPLAPAS